MTPNFTDCTANSHAGPTRALEKIDTLMARLEMKGRRRLRENGAIRLGRTTTLMTLAHELGHHLVNWLDPESTASHGNVWVHRFDQAAEVIDGLVLRSSSITAPA